jgi:energy-converting hydrogenase Eha subunit G
MSYRGKTNLNRTLGYAAATWVNGQVIFLARVSQFLPALIVAGIGWQSGLSVPFHCTARGQVGPLTGL